MRHGDTLDVVFQRVPGHEPLIHALRFNSGKNSQEYKAYLYKAENGRFAHYYDATGTEVEERLEHSPIDDYEQVTSILRDGRRHKGVDFKTPLGTPVKMPFDGMLSRKNWNFRSNGNCLELHDDQGRRIVFLHLSELPKTLVPGKRFKAGEVIAHSGNTGHTTAPHLHYQLESPSEALLDPFKIHPTYHAKLDAAQLPAFQVAREKYERMLSFVRSAATTTTATTTSAAVDRVPAAPGAPAPGPVSEVAPAAPPSARPATPPELGPPRAAR